jgi:hypothetical protein
MSDNMTSSGPEPSGRDARMSGGQIAALGCAILLLFPGGCLLLWAHGPGGVEWPSLLTGILILAVSGLLIWAAVRRRRPAGTGLPPSTPGDPE